MIDIKLLRENPEIYRENMGKKGRDEKVVSDILELDEQWRNVRLRADNLRHERNKVSEEINLAKKQRDERKIKNLIKHAKEIPGRLRELELEEKDLYKSLQERLSEIPNLMHKDVPLGKSDKDNKVRKVAGKTTKLGFKGKTHVEILENLELADFNASSSVAGNGFYYLKGDVALLNQALIRFAIDFMVKKGYQYIEPPLLINQKVAAAAGDLNAFRNALYKIESEDLYMIPTAEHPVLGMLSNKTMPEEKLPLKLFGYSMCFRKEIGSHGINEKGLWRTHQFNKVEQFIFCKPEDSWKLYYELLKNSEDIMKALRLPYRVVESCSGDLGDWKARSHDIEVWRPTTKSYGEVTSLSNCTDYQARKLNIKGVNKNGERYTLHTLNNTALATSRIMVAILENYQQKNGTVKIPGVLQKYMHGKKVIGKTENLDKRKKHKQKTNRKKRR